MIQLLATESKMVSDTDYPDVPEQPVIVENNEGSEGLSLTSWNGDSIFIPYRMVKEVTKVMLEFSKPKKKGK